MHDSYDVILTSHSPAYRFEAIRRDPGPGTWCLISSDPADLWRELAPAGRAGPAASGDRLDRARRRPHHRLASRHPHSPM